MDALFANLTPMGLLAARLGPAGAGALAVLGLAFLGLGHRAFRPASALAAAVGGAAFVAFAIDRWKVKLPVAAPLAIGAGGVVGFAVGLAWPTGGIAFATAGAAAVGGGAAAARWPEHEQVIVPATAVTGALLAALAMRLLTSFVPVAIGAVLAAVGGWGAVGASGLSAKAFRLVPAWAALLGLLLVVGTVLEHGRRGRREARLTAKNALAERESRRRREEEDRQRYAKYME
jgi:hypothetical protein